MKKIISSFKIILVSLTILLFNQNIYSQGSTSLVRAGLRSSTYGFSSFPDSAWWYNASTDMALNFSEETSPAVIWILGYTTNSGCYLNFPNPTPGTSYSKISFGSSDKNKKFLDDFDSNGVKVWLQVEPGFADVSTLIDLVLTQYGHHKSVIGFGVDVEWYKTSNDNNNEGVAVTDEEAIAWSAKIKSYNDEYLLFTKHWLISKMPPTFRDDIVFVDDSQIFDKMDDMMDEFEDWGKAFTPAKVAFQYGYSSDKKWWGNLSNPPKEIGDEILRRCPNTTDLYWVDFTAYEIWPKNFTPTSVDDTKEVKPEKFLLNQNFPNPFNPTTTIKYTIPKVEATHDLSLQLKVYDVLGEEIATLVNKKQQPGTYNVQFDAQHLTSGIYYYQLKTESFIQTRKMIVLK